MKLIMLSQYLFQETVGALTLLLEDPALGAAHRNSSMAVMTSLSTKHGDTIHHKNIESN